MSALQFSCGLDLRVPKYRRNAVNELLALVNEQLWLGHFDLWQSEGMRHVPQRAAPDARAWRPATGQLEAMLDAAVERVRALLQAFQFVHLGRQGAGGGARRRAVRDAGRSLDRGSRHADERPEPLLLVGAGKMGGAMLDGWLARGARPAQVTVLDPHAVDAGRRASCSASRIDADADAAASCRAAPS